MSDKTNPELLGESSKKRCKFCFEEMDARAVKCPHCQSWQSRGASLRGSPGVRLAAAVVPLIILAPLLFFSFRNLLSLDRLSGKGDFEKHRSGIKIVQPKMTFDSYDVVILGKVKNDTPVDWEDLQLEMTFKDADGTVIDTDTEKLYITLPAGKETSFKVRSNRAGPKESYHAFDIRVTWAEKSRF
ncbi:MAG: hypothetical protein AMJ81_08845 [Phycisphaerae bacterium SM23_33]|nr:MAG: hypothetical protein AMJ81_08845 [Phycisphaerae bacterium SM23_33]